jgi:hypothetical protein
MNTHLLLLIPITSLLCNYVSICAALALKLKRGSLEVEAERAPQVVRPSIPKVAPTKAAAARQRDNETRETSSRSNDTNNRGGGGGVSIVSGDGDSKRTSPPIVSTISEGVQTDVHEAGHRTKAKKVNKAIPQSI